MNNNPYDDNSFFDAYAKMARSQFGLETAGEWPLFQSLLSDLKNISALNLGCGYGWHTRYLATHGVSRVVGIDISENMIQEAQKNHAHSAIEYQVCSMDDFSIELSFDLVISNLAIHYTEDYRKLIKNIRNILNDVGTFLFLS